MGNFDNLLRHAYRLVDERDGGVCLHPGCGSDYLTDHHHIEFRSQAKDRIACVENIVTLCQAHHHGSEGPHESEYWREYWKQWQIDIYPYYMPKAEQNELERLKIKRFSDPMVTKRREELEEKWRTWEECRIKI